MKRLLFLFSFLTLSLHAHFEDVETLYSTVDPTSLSKLFAFYHLQKDNVYGKKALERAFFLINKHREEPLETSAVPLFHRIDLDSLLLTLTKQPEESIPLLSEEELQFVEKISSHLPHKKLKGHSITLLEEAESLPSSEIDLARAIFLSQYGRDQLDLVKSYEATLDLFALSILARLEKGASDLEKIEQISYFIFYEMLFRFPPHSLWPSNIDEYSFLPSILDSRHGVCLGVTILYLALSQRLGLDLMICTPPGHIYLSYEKDGKELNIETTARGTNVPTKRYLSIGTKYIQHKQLKEVIGVYHINSASVHWQAKNYLGAIKQYETALRFMPEDTLTQTFLGFNYVLAGEKEKGTAYLTKVRNKRIDGGITDNTLVADYLDGRVNEEGITAIYESVDETRESIFKKGRQLATLVEKYPTFRDGIFHLALTWLQLGRKKEALEYLVKYHELDPNNPVVEYYLTYLHFARLKPSLARRHFKTLSYLLEKEGHKPEVLDELSSMLKTSTLIF